jgi:hypothetical protein
VAYLLLAEMSVERSVKQPGGFSAGLTDAV